MSALLLPTNMLLSQKMPIIVSVCFLCQVMCTSPRPAHKSEWPPTNNGLLVQLEKQAKNGSARETPRVRTCDIPDVTGGKHRERRRQSPVVRSQSAKPGKIRLHNRVCGCMHERESLQERPRGGRVCHRGPLRGSFVRGGRCGVTHHQIQPGCRQASGVTRRRPRALLADLL